MKMEEQGRKQITQVAENTFLVWDIEAVKLFREKAQIVGSFIGSSSKCPFQNDQLSLPMLLMPEEVFILINFGYAKLQRLKNSHILPTVADKLKFQSMTETQIKDQAESWRCERMEEQLSMAESIARGRKAKKAKQKMATSSKGGATAKELKVRKGDLLAVTVTEKDVEEVEKEIRDTPHKEIAHEDLLVECWGQSPFHSKDAYENVKLDYPRTEKERVRLEIFKHLWEKKYFLTSGIKFGCDFLVYPGDPLKFHASHMAVCVERMRSFGSEELGAWSRVATQAKKVVLLCSLDKDGKPTFICVSWSRNA